MKKQVIIAAVALGAFVFGTNNVQAQAQATTEVNIILNDVISFGSGSVANGGQVDFNYITAADYNDGLGAVNVANSLIVTSTKNFDVKVKAEGANFTDGTNNIPVDVLTINAAAGGSMAG
ncbi:MAG: peptidoglycan-binding protein LysM, partial [Flavobacteriaceae bacterium]